MQKRKRKSTPIPKLTTMAATVLAFSVMKIYKEMLDDGEISQAEFNCALGAACGVSAMLARVHIDEICQNVLGGLDMELVIPPSAKVIPFPQRL